MKEICRLNKDWFLNGYDYIFIARKGIDEISYKALKNGMEKLAYRISKHITRET